MCHEDSEYSSTILCIYLDVVKAIRRIRLVARLVWRVLGHFYFGKSQQIWFDLNGHIFISRGSSVRCSTQQQSFMLTESPSVLGIVIIGHHFNHYSAMASIGIGSLSMDLLNFLSSSIGLISYDEAIFCLRLGNYLTGPVAMRLAVFLCSLLDMNLSDRQLSIVGKSNMSQQPSRFTSTWSARLLESFLLLTCSLIELESHKPFYFCLVKQRKPELVRRRNRVDRRNKVAATFLRDAFCLVWVAGCCSAEWTKSKKRSEFPLFTVWWVCTAKKKDGSSSLSYYHRSTSSPCRIKWCALLYVYHPFMHQLPAAGGCSASNSIDARCNEETEGERDFRLFLLLVSFICQSVLIGPKETKEEQQRLPPNEWRQTKGTRETIKRSAHI